VNYLKYHYFIILFLISFFLTPAAYAYAGPGVAIGAIIVAITVLISFIASTLIGFFNILKKTKDKIRNKTKSKNHKKKFKN
tara:strand:- start:36 stop:278 length:243 start_codon:yes stop_codon:yes gene_type:complete